jgi:Tfp pilus assembly protein PilO
VSPAAQSSPSAKNYRRYVLAAVFGILVLYFGGEWFWDTVVEGPIEAKKQERDKLREAKEKREEQWEGFQEDAARLAQWREQSLPSDTDLARSLYRHWLLEAVQAVKLGDMSVNPGEPVNRQGRYYAIPYSVRGRGSLQQLTDFLFIFYRTDLLHQIRTLSMTPLGSAGQFDLSITIETLVVPGAGPKLPEGLDEQQRYEAIAEEFRRRAARPSRRLASVTLGEYTPPTLADYEAIAGRNLFGVGDDPNEADYAYLSSITAINGELQAWFVVRTKDEPPRRLGKGDELEIGNFCGTIAEIEGSDVILESEGERWLLTLGEKLTDAFALPPEF